MTEDEMVGWHHRLDRIEFEQAPGDGEVQGSLACCSSWGCKELDTTEPLNNPVLYSRRSLNGPQSMESQRVGHHLVNNTHIRIWLFILRQPPFSQLPGQHSLLIIFSPF